jgi:hypothetical protein
MSLVEVVLPMSLVEVVLEVWSSMQEGEMVMVTGRRHRRITRRALIRATATFSSASPTWM